MIGHDLLVSKFLQGLNEEYSNLVLICEKDKELMQDYNKVVAKFMTHERNKKEVAEAANIIPNEEVFSWKIYRQEMWSLWCYWHSHRIL